MGVLYDRGGDSRTTWSQEYSGGVKSETTRRKSSVCTTESVVRDSGVVLSGLRELGRRVLEGGDAGESGTSVNRLTHVP